MYSYDIATTSNNMITNTTAMIYEPPSTGIVPIYL